MSLEYLTDVYNKILIMTSRLRSYVMVSKVYPNILVSSSLVLFLSANSTKNTFLPEIRSVNLVLWLIFNNIANVKNTTPHYGQILPKVSCYNKTRIYTL